MPSRCIFASNVVRHGPSRAAAPRGPPTTQFVSASTARMCSRVTSARLELGRALHNPLGGDAKDPVARADHGALDDVLKLTHIPGPAPLHQRLQHLVRDVGDVLAMAADELLD